MAVKRTMAEITFDQWPQRVERIEIKEQVDDANVQEHGGKEPPHLSSGHQFVDLHPKEGQHARICEPSNVP